MPLCGSSAAVQQSIGGFHYERSSRVRNLILREHSARTSRLLTLRLEVVSFEASAARTAISFGEIPLFLLGPAALRYAGCSIKCGHRGKAVEHS